MKRHVSNSGGFTLLELLMVVIIIAILAALALPGYYRAVERARGAEAVTLMGQLRGSGQRFCIENPALPNVGFTSGSSQPAMDVELPAAGSTNWDYTGTITCVSGGTPQSSITAVRNGPSPCAGSQIFMTDPPPVGTSPFTYAWIGPCA